MGVEVNQITALEITEKPNKAGDPPKTVKLVKKDDATFYAKADDSDFVVTVSKWSSSDAREKAPSDFLQEDEKQEK